MVGMDCCRSFTGRRTRGSLALSLHGAFRVQLGHASRPNLSCNCSVRGGRTIGLAQDDTTNLKSADSCKAVAHNGLCPLLAQSGHHWLHRTCPLSGVKRTWRVQCEMSANDPKHACRYNVLQLSMFSVSYIGS